MKDDRQTGRNKPPAALTGESPVPHVRGSPVPHVRAVGMICLLMSVHGAYGQQPPPAQEPIARPAPSSNQGVSLHERLGQNAGQSGGDLQHAASHNSSDEPEPRRPGQALTADRGDGKPDEPTNSRTIEKRSPRLGLRSAQPLDSAPWYRSGVVPLLVVLGGIAATFIVLRRFIPAVRATGGGVLQVVARTALSPKHNVALIQVGASRFVLVGIAGDRVTPLCDIHESDQVASLAVRCLGRSGLDGTTFDAMLELQDHEFERACQDVGDNVVDGPRGVTDAKGRLGGLLDRLQTLRDKAPG